MPGWFIITICRESASTRRANNNGEFGFKFKHLFNFKFHCPFAFLFLSVDLESWRRKQISISHFKESQNGPHFIKKTLWACYTTKWLGGEKSNTKRSVSPWRPDYFLILLKYNIIVKKYNREKQID